RVFQQTFLQVGEVAIWITCWRDPLVHLKYVNRSPGDLFFRQHPEHYPWGVTSTYCHKKDATSLTSCLCLLGNNRCRTRCRGFCIPKHFQLHGGSFSVAAS